MTPSHSSVIHAAGHATAQACFESAVRAHIAGNVHAAEGHYRAALEQRPAFPEACNNLGTILAGRGDEEDAATLFIRAVRVAPGYGEAHDNLGQMRTRQGRHAEARLAFEAAVACDPQNADWWNHLGNCLVELFRFSDALTMYDRAIAERPQDSEYWSNRALALRGLRVPDQAIASLARAIELNPQNVNALSNLGIVYKEEKRFAEAIRSFERATALEPDNSALVANFAAVYEPMGEYGRMRELAERAALLDPDNAEAHNLLGNVAFEAGQYDEARELYHRAVALDPVNRNANWNLALIALLHGDFDYGWKQFEWRKRLQSVLIDTLHYDGAEWSGDPLDGRTILLHTEQGIGDAIQFIRYAAEVKRRGAGRVVVECPWPIATLLAGVDGVDAVVARGAPLPPWDVHTNLLSLPLLLGTTLETIPGQVPYIPVEPREAADRVSDASGETTSATDRIVRVGIVWAGNPVHQRDLIRSVSLARFASLATLPGVRLYSLQKGESSERALEALFGSGIRNLAPALGDFRDTAAVIDRLDLVIAVDTSVAHLAGALGKPVWILLPHVPDFRWMLDRSDSPWYPSARLFRQQQPRDWEGVFARVAVALGELVRERGLSARSSHAPSAVPSAITTLVSATRLPDDRPRFDMWIPLEVLADHALFAAYEAELLGRGGGHDRAIREFFDQALSSHDVVLDLQAGLGLTALSVATSPRGARCIAAASNTDEGERLTQVTATRGLAGRLAVVTSATAGLAQVGDDRVSVRSTSIPQLEAVLDSPECSGTYTIRRLAVLALSGVVPNDARGLIARMDTASFTVFTVTWDGEDVSLQPIAEWGQPQDLLLLSEAFLAELAETSAPPGASVVGPVAAPALPTRVGIDWEVRSDSGWGVYGLNLMLHLTSRTDVRPACFAADVGDLTPLTRQTLATVLREAEAFVTHVRGGAEAQTQFDGLLLRALGNNFGMSSMSARLRAARNVGVIFFEDTAFDADALERARQFDCLVAGSNWNAEVLRAHGLTNVCVVQQGIDPTVFHPAPRSGQFGNRFVVFSGGKLEYRKGQDIVVAAFRRFHARHPEALLVTAWHNNWPQLVTDLSLAGHVTDPQVTGEGQLDVADWLTQQGIPPDATCDVGRVPNARMGQITREADLAIFPNRCEGGTNLVAMECMASGVPTIVSANTGHLDLVATGGCIALAAQTTVAPPTRFFRCTGGWGESSVDELVDAMECLHQDRALAAAIARDGAAAMSHWTWPAQIDRLLSELAPLLERPLAPRSSPLTPRTHA